MITWTHKKAEQPIDWSQLKFGSWDQGSKVVIFAPHFKFYTGHAWTPKTRIQPQQVEIVMILFTQGHKKLTNIGGA